MESTNPKPRRTSASKVQATATVPAPVKGEEPQEWVNRRATAQATRAANARQVSGRRRFVDPTTCERDYSNAEMEFMQAMHDYKQRSGRMFPTWSEVLEVLKALGYAKLDAVAGSVEPAAPAVPAKPVSARVAKTAQPA
ncbi:MAG: hypothetical protein U0794_15515 [Isosphaeraceae bacterium]